MSQENVEIVRRAWTLFSDGLERGEGLDAGIALYDEGLFAPDSTLTPVREIPGGGTFVGREGFAEIFHVWTDDWDGWSARLEETIDAPDDRVVAVVHQSARGRTSGITVENRFWAVYTVRDGQVIDQVHYLDRSEALDAAGLSQ